MNISLQTTFYLLIVSFVLIIVLALWIFVLQRKMKRMLMSGTENLSDHLISTKNHIEDLRDFEKKINEYLNDIEKRVSRSVQSIETVRFTPFTGVNSVGNQSFSTSFVNESGDGIVVSGLYYSRDRVSIFTKPVKAFSSEHSLTDEEKEALERSKASLQGKQR